MNKIILIVSLLGGGYFGAQKLLPTFLFDPVNYKGETAVVDYIMHYDWKEFEEANSGLEALAESNTITIVDFYSETCGTCKKLTYDYKDLLDVRNDVYIKRIILPEPENGSVAEAEATRYMQDSNEMKEKLGKLNVCGTPHITIFKPDRSVLIQDICQNRRAMKYLIDWIDREYDKLDS